MAHIPYAMYRKRIFFPFENSGWPSSIDRHKEKLGHFQIDTKDGNEIDLYFSFRPNKMLFYRSKN